MLTSRYLNQLCWCPSCNACCVQYGQLAALHLWYMLNVSGHAHHADKIPTCQWSTTCTALLRAYLHVFPQPLFSGIGLVFMLKRNLQILSETTSNASVCDVSTYIRQWGCGIHPGGLDSVCPMHRCAEILWPFACCNRVFNMYSSTRQWQKRSLIDLDIISNAPAISMHLWCQKASVALSLRPASLSRWPLDASNNKSTVRQSHCSVIKPFNTICPIINHPPCWARGNLVNNTLPCDKAQTDSTDCWQ